MANSRTHARDTMRTSPLAPSAPSALSVARTCYDHLAGAFGVAVLTALVDADALRSTDPRALIAPVSGAGRDAFELGLAAGPVFTRLGVDLGGLLARPASTRPLLRFCVDWTEHRYHLAGALGAAVLAAAESAGWVIRHPGSRVVDVTDAGRHAFDTVGPARYDVS